MLFNSTIFLFGFLPIAYLVFWQLRSRSARYLWLTVTGYVFYGYWRPAFCLLLAFSTLVSYFAGLGFRRWQTDERLRKLLLITPITIDLLLLGFFKYADFGLRAVNGVLTTTGHPAVPLLQIILPVGISFYTFHTITYIVDSYRRVIVPTRNVFEFACYVSLFSQLVAGPIVRFSELRSDLENIDRKCRRDALDDGWSFFLLGLIQKILIADSIAAVIDPALKDAAGLSSIGTWLCMLGYTYQLYFDFAGYSNMAVGLGHLFGMSIPQNFNSPYVALNPSDFWRRWHISLSRCLQDYLYIPLGGSRDGDAKTYRNLMTTMLLGGLWHGAAWTFVVWGGYHGLLLVMYRRFGASWDRLSTGMQRTATFLLVVFGWTLFRSESWQQAAVLFTRLLVPHTGVLPTAWPTLASLILIAGLLAHKGPNSFEMAHRWRPLAACGLTILFAVCLVRIYGGEDSPFLYFQF
jgi:alginate O-acetyltransferase complex protein AlgI